ncbi:MAG: ABC transporter permease [Acidimicrobiales bacterium]
MSTTTTPAESALIVEDALRAALSSRARPPRPGALTTSLAFGWRALLKIKHVPEQLFDVTMFPIMFTLMFTYLFGGEIAGSPQDYLQYLLPGILVQTVLWITMYTGMGLNTDIEKGVFDRIRTLPIWRPSAIVGALFGDAARYTIASAITLGLGFALGFRTSGGGAPGLLASVLLLLVLAFSLSWVWTSFGLIMRTQNAVMYSAMMVLFPLTFASNIFVRPETMPGWLEGAVNVNPVTHLVSAVRGLMIGDVDAGEIGWVLVASAVLVGVFGPLTMRLYNRRR